MRAAPGFRVLERKRTVSVQADTQTKPFLVERLPKLRVRVVDVQGNVVPNANVTATFMKAMSNSATSSSKRPPLRFERDIAEPVRSDKNGLCSLTLKEGEPHSVQIFASASIDGAKLFGNSGANTPTDRTIDVVVRSGWKIKGRVVKDGTGVRDVNVAIHAVTSSGIGGVVPYSTSRTVATTRTGENGEYQFEVMAGPSYNVSLINDGANRAVGRVLRGRKTPTTFHQHAD
jgi:hypothetical protein